MSLRMEVNLCFSLTSTVTLRYDCSPLLVLFSIEIQTHRCTKQVQSTDNRCCVWAVSGKVAWWVHLQLVIVTSLLTGKWKYMVEKSSLQKCQMVCTEIRLTTKKKINKNWSLNLGNTDNEQQILWSIWHRLTSSWHEIKAKRQVSCHISLVFFQLLVPSFPTVSQEEPSKSNSWIKILYMLNTYHDVKTLVRYSCKKINLNQATKDTTFISFAMALSTRKLPLI